MDYYDPAKILEDEEKIHVQFNHVIENFGFYLNSSTTTISKGVDVKMPLFLVKFLIQNEYCSVMDTTYSKIKYDLEADSSIVDLNQKHFYHLAAYGEGKEKLSNIKVRVL